jgi:hypothetical protein
MIEQTTINYQLSIINYQLSIINYQLSIINYQLSINSVTKVQRFIGKLMFKI